MSNRVMQPKNPDAGHCIENAIDMNDGAKKLLRKAIVQVQIALCEDVSEEGRQAQFRKLAKTLRLTLHQTMATDNELESLDAMCMPPAPGVARQ